MPRIRTIKPEFWADEKLGPLAPIDRLVFLGLVSMADDEGRVLDSSRFLNGLLFAHTSDDCTSSLELLAGLAVIRRGVTASGQRVVQIVGWEKHQRVEKPNPRGALPPIKDAPNGAHRPRKRRPDAISVPGNVGEESGRSRGNVPDASGKDLGAVEVAVDLGPGTYDLRPGSVDLPARAHEARASLPGPNGHSADPTPPPEDPDPLGTWLGLFAPLIADNPLAARPRDRRSLLSEYGPSGLRANVWRLPSGDAVPIDERPRLFALGLNSYAREGNRKIVGNEFSGAIRTLAIQESALPRGSPNGTGDAYLTPAQYRRYCEIRTELENGGMDPDEAAAEADQRARRE